MQGNISANIDLGQSATRAAQLRPRLNNQQTQNQNETERTETTTSSTTGVSWQGDSLAVDNADHATLSTLAVTSSQPTSRTGPVLTCIEAYGRSFLASRSANFMESALQSATAGALQTLLTNVFGLSPEVISSIQTGLTAERQAGIRSGMEEWARTAVMADLGLA